MGQTQARWSGRKGRATPPETTAARRSAPPRVRIAAATALLVLCWLTLPVQLQHSALDPSDEMCLTLADEPPSGLASLATLERCTVLLPDDGELLADLGAMYEAGGRLADAEAIYRRLLARDNEYGDLHVRIAKLLRVRGAIDEARAHAEAALRLQPNRRAVQNLLTELTPIGPTRDR